MSRLTHSRVFTLILCALLLTGTASCGGTAASDDTTTAADAVTTEAAPVGYDYEGIDYGGYEFKFFNFDQCWGCTIRLDAETQTGDVMNDAVFSRNQKVEEMMNIDIKEITFKYTSWNASQVAMADQFSQSVLAGDHAYDAAYLPVSFKPAVVTDGYLMDLNSIPELQLQEAWWDSVFNDALTINGKLFTASSPLYLMSMDQATVLYFNKDLLDDLKLDYPYQLVRDGKWTLDKWQEYITACTMLNGDDSFEWNKDGNSIYGVGGHHEFPIALAYAADSRVLTRKGDSLSLAIESERFVNTMEKLASILSTHDGSALFYVAVPSAPAEANPGNLFKAGRAAFSTLEVKDALAMRDFEVSFGLIPMPKYDEAQKSYYSYVADSVNLLGIPATTEDPARTGKILDALSYESNVTCMPLYYDTVLAYKGMRDEDSIEMLQIVKESRVAETAQFLGVTKPYVTALNNTIVHEKGGQASLAASYKSAIEASLEGLLKAFE